jgi:biotin carboxyl carrier protein
MTMYHVTIGTRVYRVNISSDQSTVDGKAIDAEVVRLNRNGLHMIRRGKQALELFLSSLDGETYQMVLQGGQRIATHITSRLRKRAKHGTAESQEQTLVAPMPGLVVEVRVQEGKPVEAGETLLVLESMKMQMQIRSKVAGKIYKVLVQPGSQVEKGAVLVQFEHPTPEEKNHD